MPKLNKPRSTPLMDQKVARELLGLHDIDPAEVKEVSHFKDGSMSVIVGCGEKIWHIGFEFDPELTTELARAFRTLGVRVDRDAY